MTSAVAERSDRRASRSASWSVMHSDEEFARILQVQEEQEYQDHLAAKEMQCQNDQRLAQLLSEGHFEGRMDVDEFRGTSHQTQRSTANRSSSNSTSGALGRNSQNATVISINDSDSDFSECFEDTTFDELASVLERAQNEAEQLVEQQEAADTRTRNEEIAEVLQNDEQMNGMLENEGVVLESNGDTSFDPIVISPSSAADGVSVSASLDLSDRRGPPTEFSPIFIDASNSDDWMDESESMAAPGTSPTNNSLLTSVNVAWNVVGSAVNWVSGLFSGVQYPPQSNFNNGVTSAYGDAEEDDEDEEEEDEDDDGWDTDEDSERYDDDDDDDDDEEMDSDTDDTDDYNVEVSIDFGDDLGGRGLVQEEIDILPTRTYQSRLPQQTTTTTTNAGASANEHQCQNECQVCLSSFVDGDVLRTLPCCHHFHSACIDTWIQRNAVCPVCRVRIRDEIGY